MSTTRRRFLQQSGLVLGTTTLAIGVTRPRGEDEIRVGLVGCGGRGTGAAAQALKADPGVRLVAMGDAFPDRIDRSLAGLQEKTELWPRVDVPVDRRFAGFDAFQKVIGADVDVVVLATPPHFRPEHFEAAIQAGKHVFMEKPVAVDGFGVRKVLAAGKEATRKGLNVVVGLQRHYQSGYRQLIEAIHRGQIGSIVAARCYWNMGALWHRDRDPNWSSMEHQLRNWLYYAWLSGDHIVEQHVHNLDVVNWAKQSYPVRCSGSGGRQVRTDPRFGHIFDHHSVHYEYADGSFCFSECRQIPGCHNQVSEHLIGTEGRVDFHNQFSLQRYDSEEVVEPTGGGKDPYQVEHDELFAAIRAGQARLSDAENGALSTLTAIMGRMATYTGRVITSEEALQSPRLGPDHYGFAEVPYPPVPVPGVS